MSDITTTPQPKPRWILSVKDLPAQVKPARYKVTMIAGETKEITLAKRKRQVVDALMHVDLFCASTVRLGDAVFRLKEDHGRFVKRGKLSNGREFYTLTSKVEFLGEVV